MKNSFDNLLEHYNFLFNRTISEKLKKQYKKHLVTPPPLPPPINFINKVPTNKTNNSRVCK